MPWPMAPVSPAKHITAGHGACPAFNSRRMLRGVGKAALSGRFSSHLAANCPMSRRRCSSRVGSEGSACTLLAGFSLGDVVRSCLSLDGEQSHATANSWSRSLLGYCQPTGGKHQFKPQTLLAPMM